MRENKKILIIIGILVLIGVVLYFSYQLGQKSTEAKIKTVASEFLTSKVVQEWNAVAFGEVTEISGRNLTLYQKGDSLNILISEDAFIYRLLPSEETSGTLQSVKKEEIKFEEIKIGDRVNISCQLKADGSLEGKAVNVLLTP